MYFWVFVWWVFFWEYWFSYFLVTSLLPKYTLLQIIEYFKILWNDYFILQIWIILNNGSKVINDRWKLIWEDCSGCSLPKVSWIRFLLKARITWAAHQNCLAERLLRKIVEVKHFPGSSRKQSVLRLCDLIIL